MLAPIAQRGNDEIYEQKSYTKRVGEQHSTHNTYTLSSISYYSKPYVHTSYLQNPTRYAKLSIEGGNAICTP